ncbi:MAG: cell wall-binding repeat-containing protein [Eubacterium sp.]|nr:cell wall-binding repeat-containing protein [Eubacterium sp.]
MNFLTGALKRMLAIFLSLILVILMMPLENMDFSYAEPEDVDIKFSNKNLKITANFDVETYKLKDVNDNVEISVTGMPDGRCSKASEGKAEITFTNTLNVKVNLSFTITELVLNGGNITVDGKPYKDKPTEAFSFELDGKKSIKIILTSDIGAKTSSLKLEKIGIFTNTNSDVTYSPGSNGKISVNDEEISSKTVKKVTGNDIIKLNAVADEGYRFFGWYINGQFISDQSELTTSIFEDSLVEGKFTNKDNATYKVGELLFDELNTAIEETKTGAKTIIVTRSGRVPAGEYTIPDGVTLLLPMNNKYQIIKENPILDTESYNNSKVHEFSKLTFSNGARLNIASGGSVSIAAKQLAFNSIYSYSTSGPIGDYGRIDLDEGSHIEVKDKGALYVSGFLTGKGTINLNPGAVAYEDLEVADWRGGSATSKVYYDKVRKAFPFTQYHAQNIQSPMTIQNGANVKAVFSVTAMGISRSVILDLIGGKEPFIVTEENSSVTYTYDPINDKAVIDINGRAKLNKIYINLAGQEFDSKNYVLPICNNIIINVQPASTLDIINNTSMSAGSKINISEGATVNILENANLYVVDQKEWNGKGIGQFKNYGPAFIWPQKTVDKISLPYKDQTGPGNASIDVNGVLNIEGQLFTSKSGADIKSSQGTGKINIKSAPRKAGPNEIYYAGNAEKHQNTEEFFVKIDMFEGLYHNGPSHAETNPYTSSEGNAAGSQIYWSKESDKWINSNSRKHKISMQFKSDNDETELPDEIKNMLPKSIDDVLDGEAYILPNYVDIVSSGKGVWKFKGFEDPEGAVDETGNIKILMPESNYFPKKAVELKGVWTLDSTGNKLLFDANGSDKSAPETKNYVVGNIIKLTDMKRDGYEFDCWNSLKDGNGTSYKAGENFTMPNEEVTLYAKWNRIYTIKYEYKVDGKNAPDAINALIPDYEKTTVEKEKLTAVKPSKTKEVIGENVYNFTSYEKNIDEENATITFIGNWTESDAMHLIYDGNGGSGELIDSNIYDVNNNRAKTQKNAFERKGYTFDHWNTKSDDKGISYGADEEVDVSKTPKLFAIWKRNHEVKYVFISDIQEDVPNEVEQLLPSDKKIYYDLNEIEQLEPGAKELIVKNVRWTFDKAGFTKSIEDKDGENVLVKFTGKWQKTDLSELPRDKRISGEDRFATAKNIAVEIKNVSQKSKFDNIVIANGESFPDALSGTYLAKVKNAPLILSGNSEETSTIKFVKEHLSENGKVYLLGGKAVISRQLEEKLSAEYNTKRLDGADRFETNIKILKEAGVDKEEIMVCNAYDFADSMSASATGKPIFLVGDKIDKVQMDYLKSIKPAKFWLIGGTKAVNKSIDASLSSIQKCERISGSNRYETSVAVAETFFDKNLSKIVFASGNDFPDGLAGSVLAINMKSPLILTAANSEEYAAAYAKKVNAKSSIILGGVKALTDSGIEKIMSRKLIFAD